MVIVVIEIKAFIEDFDHADEFFYGTPFEEQLLTEHLLVQYLSMAASIILQMN